MHETHPFPAACWRLALVAALVALLGGCSLVGLAYENADLWLLHEVDEYVVLRPAQRERLRVALRTRLEQHRARELPAYIDFLDRAHAAAADGLTTAEVEQLLARIQGLAAELVRETIPAVAPVLADIDEGQRVHLAARLQAGDRKYEEDYIRPAAAKRLAKRAKATGKQLAHWIGDLSPAQRERVGDLTRAWPDVAARWLTYRAARTEGLMALLQRRADPADLQDYLVSRWVRHEGQADDLGRDVAAIRGGIVTLIVAVDGSLTPSQRKALLDRLAGYRADLAALLPRGAPAMASVAVPGMAAAAQD